MGSATPTPESKRPPSTEADLSVLEFLELTGGVPPAEAPELVAKRRREFLESLDPDDCPF